MSTLYRIAPAPSRKPYRTGLFFRHKTDFGAVFATERSCAASILKLNRRVSDRISCRSLGQCEQMSNSSGRQELRSEDWNLL